jgi:hypothetical protein
LFDFSESLPTTFACFAKSVSYNASTASIPRFKSIGFAQQRFQTFFYDSLRQNSSGCSSVSAKSLVLEATSFHLSTMFSMDLSILFLCYTIFSNVWSPKLFNNYITTFPRLLRFANASTPRFNPSRASISNFISFAIFILYFSPTL